MMDHVKQLVLVGSLLNLTTAALLDDELIKSQLLSCTLEHALLDAVLETHISLDCEKPPANEHTSQMKRKT